MIPIERRKSDTYHIESVPGKRITSIMGLVSEARSVQRMLLKDMAAGLKNIIGGELKSYTQLLEEARSEAMQRMIYQAEQSAQMLWLT